MKTSLIGILVVSSVLGWVAVGCVDDEALLTPATKAATPQAGGDGGAPLDEAAGAAARGETGGSGPASITSGVDPEKPLNGLTSTETEQLCQAIAPPALEVASDPDKFRGTCVLRIIQAQFIDTLTTLEQCQEAMIGCDTTALPDGSAKTDAPLPSVLAAGLACVSATPNINPTCRANVGELEGCITAGLGTLDVANQQTCDTIISGVAARQIAQSLGNSGVLTCQGYQRKCPDGFAIGSGGEGS
jgi:hypothetical protein